MILTYVLIGNVLCETELIVYARPNVISYDQVYAYGDLVVLQCRCDQAMMCENGSTLQWRLEKPGFEQQRLIVHETKNISTNAWYILKMSIDYKFRYGHYHCCVGEICDKSAIRILYRKC